jgi:hypothetical protein
MGLDDKPCKRLVWLENLGNDKSNQNGSKKYRERF